jgi:hypothetical protein
VAAGSALNYASAALPATLSSSALSSGAIHLTSMPGAWPSVPFKMLVDWGTATCEAVIVTAVSGSGPFTLTCTRGADGTIAQAHSSGATVVHGFSAEEFAQGAALGVGIFNVCDPQYAGGAKGNGSADDTAAIQAAANALSANGGGRLYFPCTGGDYVTSSSVTVSSYGDGLLVCGDGYGSRIKATGNYDTLVINAGNGVAIRDLYFDSTVGRNAADAGCATTNGSNQVTDPQAATADVGSAISGPGIPGGTTITAVNTGTHTYTISNNATATASPVTLTVIGSTAGYAINLQTGGSVRINNVWCYNSFRALGCFNGGGRTEIVGSWFYGRDVGIYTQNPLHVLSTGVSGDSIGVVADSVNGSLWFIGCDLNGICSLVTRNTLGLAQPNYGITMINVGANYNGGGITPAEGVIGFDYTQCYGELRQYACYASGSSIRIGGRADSATLTSGSAVVADTSAISGDVGKNVYGSGIPAGATILSVSAGTSFTMSANATGAGSRTLGIGGPITQDIELYGGDYGGDNSTPPHGIPQAVLINSAQNIRISGIQLQGAASNAYPGILVNALTGPLSISGMQVTRPTLYAVDISALGSTAGPVNISGCQFNGEFVTNPINYNASFQANYTFLGNDAGPNIVSGATIGGQSNAYAGPLTSALTGITSSSLASVTQLGVAVASGGTYEIEFWMYLSSTTSSGPNVGFGVASPSASFGVYDIFDYTNTTASREVYFASLGSTGSLTLATASSTLPLRIKVLATFTASGTVYPQLSASSGGGTTTVQAGSYAVARRIS